MKYVTPTDGIDKPSIRLNRNTKLEFIFPDGESREDFLRLLDHLRRLGPFSGFDSYYEIGKQLEETKNYTIKTVHAWDGLKDRQVRIYDIRLLMNDFKQLMNLYIEIQLLRRLRHPRIIIFHEVFESAKLLHLVFEAPTFGNLSENIGSLRAKGVEEKIQVMIELVEALSYIHDHNIVHRDLHPKNISVMAIQPILVCKVGGFEFATHIDLAEGSKKVWTPGYQAPEIFGDEDIGKNYTFGSDVFSLGCIFFMILTHKEVFSSHRKSRIAKKNKEGQSKLSPLIADPSIPKKGIIFFSLTELSK
eukprot:TRINITY_DN6690_c0_g1_i2.p1 TRINITY_DN6690_c0_g1~~TRINITY_DN6690_c0_g1_i2.p1  ORF type:complete len:304 (+),score=39.22 TRINITY_DN6690_c0_g1_i2:351-1262(+)